MKKVLVVEDDAFIRDISSIKLTEHGYDVLAVENGVFALEALKSSLFDVVVLDLELPDISGYEILKTIRTDTTKKNLPVIVFSNRDDEPMKSDVTELGVSGYFVKAATEFTELFKIIDAL